MLSLGNANANSNFRSVLFIVIMRLWKYIRKQTDRACALAKTSVITIPW